jgi:MYXO-CTERM domain-containing protein
MSPTSDDASRDGSAVEMGHLFRSDDLLSNNIERTMRQLKHSLMALMAMALVGQTANASESLDIPVSSGGNTSTRHLNYYAPPGLNHPAMVIAMHGAGGNGDNLAEGWGWDAIAEREKILVVTPSGNGGQWVIWGDDDVDFIKAIIETMADRFDIDRNRVYATGWSMGGMMSYYLACHLPDKIAAIGPSSGYLIYGQSGCSDAHHVPIYHIHGQWDDFVKYSDLHDYLNNNWINAYGCPTTADTSDAGTRPDPNTPGTTLREYWGPCLKDGKTSEIYLETYWKPHAYGNQETEVFWNFFKNYSLSDAIPGVAIYQHNDFKGRMNRLVAGSYNHSLLKAVGIPDGVISSIRMDTGLTVELFDNDNFQNPMATYQNDVADLSAMSPQITAMRITSGSPAPTGCVADAERAYQGTPGAVPGTIEAENFDTKGYYDETPGNEGGAYRTDLNVDIKEVNGGYAVGWMTTGEWLEYTVNVASEGDYDLTLTSGAVDPGRTADVSVCGVPAGTFNIPQVSTWGEFTTSASVRVHLAAGLQQIRLTVGSADYLDLDSLHFTSPNDSPGDAGSSADAGGTADSGIPVDAGGATTPADGGVGGADGGTGDSARTSGCSCRASSENSTPTMAATALLFAVAVLGRRRRSR